MDHAFERQKLQDTGSAQYKREVVGSEENAAKKELPHAVKREQTVVRTRAIKAATRIMKEAYSKNTHVQHEDVLGRVKHS